MEKRREEKLQLKLGARTLITGEQAFRQQNEGHELRSHAAKVGKGHFPGTQRDQRKGKCSQTGWITSTEWRQK